MPVAAADLNSADWQYQERASYVVFSVAFETAAFHAVVALVAAIVAQNLISKNGKPSSRKA